MINVSETQTFNWRTPLLDRDWADHPVLFAHPSTPWVRWQAPRRMSKWSRSSKKMFPFMGGGGEWIGTLDGLVNADVGAQVTGYLLKQGYQEGAFVRAKVSFFFFFRLTHVRFRRRLDQAQGATSTSQGVTGECPGGARSNST